MNQTKNKSIVLFDGLCNLCNSSVRFILKHDKKEQYSFASLQSDASTKLLLHLNYKKDDLNSIVLIEGVKVYNKSTAVLRIAKELRPLWNCSYLFIIIPEFIRDSIYDFIAKNRYKWFGKRKACQIHNLKYKDRFIN
ncbi:MAG: DUF393 domain-containing protein [Flavobacteriaceae bacterium]|nr:DUF393 domain-containing protein [Flavobacteriaceae bacterium]